MLASAVVLALVVVGDLSARRLAENRLEDRARSEAGQPGSVDARIRSFPVLARLVLSSTVAEVEVHLLDVDSGPVDLAAVDVALRGVRLDRDKMLSGQAELEDIDRGTVTVEIDAAAIEEVVNLPVSISGDRISVRYRGVSVSARAETGRDGALVLRAGRLPPLTVPVARSRLISCVAARATIVNGRVRLACDIAEVPPGLQG